jgi:GT2 family glycosyltransferase
MSIPAVHNETGPGVNTSPRILPVDDASGGADDLVSVVIVNFNAGDYLAAAVESVLGQTEVVTEIIVVDNASSDGSLQSLRARVPADRIRIIELDDNYGFAYACNAGITASRGSSVLLLNPDCRMHAGSLALLKWMIQGRPDVGMTGPLIVNPDGSEQRGCRRDIPNPWQIFCVAFGLHRLMPDHPRFRDYAYDAAVLPDRPSEVPAISGACMLVRRAAIDAVGHLDSGYFLHFEDLDWCMRFQSAGLKILFVPGAVVEHTQGVCSRSRPIRVEAYKHRSLVRFLRKNFTTYYPSSFMAVVSALVLARFASVSMRMLVRGRTAQRGAWERLMRGPRADK